MLAVGVLYLFLEKSILVHNPKAQGDLAEPKPDSVSRMILGGQVSIPLSQISAAANEPVGWPHCARHACNPIKRCIYSSSTRSSSGHSDRWLDSPHILSLRTISTWSTT